MHPRTRAAEGPCAHAAGGPRDSVTAWPQDPRWRQGCTGVPGQCHHGGDPCSLRADLEPGFCSWRRTRPG